jgi:hypothetical protein
MEDLSMSKDLDARDLALAPQDSPAASCFARA